MVEVIILDDVNPADLMVRRPGGFGDDEEVADPGMVAARGLILDPLARLGVDPAAVTHVFISHHHPDHTVNIALFPNAEVVDFWARYRADEWLDHEGHGYRLSLPRTQLWLTPGHTEEDATLMVEATTPSTP